MNVKSGNNDQLLKFKYSIDIATYFIIIAIRRLKMKHIHKIEKSNTCINYSHTAVNFGKFSMVFSLIGKQ